jgi:hypothetical protein
MIILLIGIVPAGVRLAVGSFELASLEARPWPCAMGAWCEPSASPRCSRKARWEDAAITAGSGAGASGWVMLGSLRLDAFERGTGGARGVGAAFGGAGLVRRGR